MFEGGGGVWKPLTYNQLNTVHVQEYQYWWIELDLL